MQIIKFDNNYDVLHPVAVEMANIYGFEMGAYGGFGNRAGDVRRATDVESCKGLIYGNVNALNNQIDSPINYYVLSQGVKTSIIEKACLLSGCNVIRTTIGKPIMGCANNSNTIYAYGLYESGTVAQIKAVIDNIIDNGYCGMFFTHAVVSVNPTQYQTSYADWLEIMTYIKNKVDAGYLDVVNVSEMINEIRENF